MLMHRGGSRWATLGNFERDKKNLVKKGDYPILALEKDISSFKLLYQTHNKDSSITY
jgi:hypothetical protein